MKNLLRMIPFNFSILPHLSMSAIVILTFFFAFPKIAHAECVNPPLNATSCTSSAYSCSYTSSGGLTSLVCCSPIINGKKECDAYKAALKDKVTTNECVPWDGTAIKFGEINCGINGKSWRCPGQEACNTLKNAGKTAIDPVDVCDVTGNNAECTACKAKNGIWTALGCIPFGQDDFVVALIKIIMGIAGFIALAMMLTGTIIIMTGGGSSEQMKKGREIFTGAAIGLFFLIFSVVVLQIMTKDVIKIDIENVNQNSIQNTPGRNSK